MIEKNFTFFAFLKVKTFFSFQFLCYLLLYSLDGKLFHLANFHFLLFCTYLLFCLRLYLLIKRIIFTLITKIDAVKLSTFETLFMCHHNYVFLIEIIHSIFHQNSLEFNFIFNCLSIFFHFALPSHNIRE